MSRLSGGTHGWRSGVGLVVAVALVHGWLATQVPLTAMPRWHVTVPALRLVMSDAADTLSPPMTQPPVPQAVSLAPAPVIAPVMAPVIAPVFKPNRPTAPINTAQAAINNVAIEIASPIKPAAPEASAVEKTQTQPPPPANELAVQVPGPTRLLYDTLRQAGQQTRRGQAQLVWQHDGDHYQAQMSWHAADGNGLPGTGRRIHSSTGRVVAGGLQPIRFANRVRGEQAAHFEPEQARVRFSANTPDAPWQPGTQDALSVWLQLAALLAANPGAYPASSQITLMTATVREAANWVFQVEGMQPLDLPGGQRQALKLTRAARGDYDSNVQVWLAPDMHYLPVRLRTEWPNGDYLDQQWRATDVP